MLKPASTFSPLLNSTNAKLHSALENLDIHPFTKVTQRSGGVRELISGVECLNFGSNDYLGLRHDPRMIEAATNALNKYGTGVGASRLMCGNIPLHQELEEAISDWLGREETIVFSTGYGANLGTIAAILTDTNVALCDNGLHSSIIDGCLLSGAKMRKFRSDNPLKLNRLLKKYDQENIDSMVLLESIYSMEGNILDIETMLQTKKQFPNTPLYVDEAHSLGITGPQGSGMVKNCSDPSSVDLVMGVLSKSLGSCGGFVSGSKEIIHAIRANARTSLFTTGGVPAALGAALKGVEIAKNEEFRRENITVLSNKLRAGLNEIGLKTGEHQSHIIPLYLGDPALTVDFANDLFNQGIYTGVALHPAVPKSKSLLRFCISALHSEASVQECIEKVADVAMKYSQGSNQTLPQTEVA